MDNTLIQKLKEAIAKSNSIGIAVGANPSLDDMAAALSLYLLLQGIKKPVSIASAAKPLVEHSSLIAINKVQRALGGDSGDLVVSFPYIEGEIEKVSYTLEEGFLNIIVKAAENGLSFDERDVKYTRGTGSVDLLCVVGTPQLSEINAVIDSSKLQDVKIINIDNKRENQGFGDIVFVSSEFSSVSEQIAEFAFSLGLRIDQDTAQNLLSGIMVATKNFQDPRTSSLAFEMGGLMMKRGAKRMPIAPKSNPAQAEALTNAAAAHLQQQPRQFGTDLSQRLTPPPVKKPVETPYQPTTQQSVKDENDTPPSDWLSPKVYKGSSNF